MASKSHQIRSIDCDGLRIAASVEAFEDDSCPFYFPANCLLFIERGRLELMVQGQKFEAKAGEFLLVRKYTDGLFRKFGEGDPPLFREYIFGMYDSFIREVIDQIPISEGPPPSVDQVLPLEDHPALVGFISSIKAFLTGQMALNHELIRLKTQEALLALSLQKPELIPIFKQFAQPERADLQHFMYHNFTQNLPLEEMALLSGRSLSTFNREFRKIFQISPRKWLQKMRLERARQLLVEASKKPVDIYLEVGFEDLAHFSRSFKQAFGYPPSEARRRVQWTGSSGQLI